MNIKVDRRRPVHEVISTLMDQIEQEYSSDAWWGILRGVVIGMSVDKGAMYSRNFRARQRAKEQDGRTDEGTDAPVG